MVIRTLGMDDLKGPLLSVTPVAYDATFVPEGVPAHPLRLPRDAHMARAPAGLVLASARAKHEVVLHRPEAAWVAATLAWPVTAETAVAALPLPHAVVHDVLGYLVAAGMAVPAEGERAGAGVAPDSWWLTAVPPAPYRRTPRAGTAVRAHRVTAATPTRGRCGWRPPGCGR
ncbi:hypothetical protein GCM10020256_50570 [Streptomyces thermocoprophilus]